MARLVIEDAALYIMAFYLVSSVIFGMGIFNTFLPNQKWDPNTMSLVPANTEPSPSIFGNTNDWNSTLGKYGNATDSANPNSMLDPVGIVKSVGFYIGFISDLISSTMLYYVLLPFIGAQWGHVITFVLNIITTIVFIRVITGRIRWD